MTLSLISSYKFLFLLWYTFITVCERGFLTVGTPVLIKMYGVEIGTHVIKILKSKKNLKLNFSFFI
jgi:hypothetical protein